jgi:hypothetical protein
MSSSYSYSDSYSVVDVRKVMDQIHADMRMIAQSTGLWTQGYADEVMADVIRFAEEDYLDRIRIRLIRDGKNIRVYDYDVHRDVSGWEGVRAGGNLWNGMAERMSVTLNYSDEWQNLNESDQAAFKATLNISWGLVTDDLSVGHLDVSDQRTYVSNGYGVKKTVFG